MALANFTIADVGAATPAFAATSSTPLHVDLGDLLYSPAEHQQDAPSTSQGRNEPFAPPTNQQRRPKVRKRAGTAYLPPPNQYTHYPEHPPQNPYQLNTQIYQHNTRLDVQIENQRVQEVNSRFDNTGQYIHDATGDYDYEQRRLNQNPQNPGFDPGYADVPYGPSSLSTPSSSRRFDGNVNQNVNSFNSRPSSTAVPPRPSNENTKTSNSENPQTPPDRPRGFTKVETGGSGGKTQLHAVLDYDDDYYDDPEPDSGQPAVTPLQGPILLRNGSVPVVPLTSYPTINNGSYYQIPPRIKVSEPSNSDDILSDYCLICDKIGPSSQLSSELGDM